MSNGQSLFDIISYATSIIAHLLNITMTFKQDYNVAADMNKISRPAEERELVPERSPDTKRKNTDNLLKFSPSSQLFSNIVGYNDVKKLFSLSLTSEKPVHVLLVGPPASAKTLFMLECMKLQRSYFTLGSHSTRSGMIDYLFTNRPRYLIVDEIEHMPMKDQTALLSLMESGMITETKFQKTRKTQLKTWVFATSNGTDRMLTLEGITEEIATSIAESVWNKMKSKDIRDCMKIGHLAKTKDEVEWLVQTLKNYRK